MLRRLFLAIAAAMLCTVAVPAEAHTDACTFYGSLYTSTPLPAVTVAPGPTVDWFWIPTFAPCAVGSGLIAGGKMTGSVFGTTTGTGTASGGHTFAFTGVGGVMVSAGQVVGSFTMTPDVLTTTGDTFLVRGTLAFVH